MSTQEQIKANQQNARKSTGPRTDEGKAVVSQNAVKHGLFAAEAVIKGEDPADYEAYLDTFLAELVPVGAVETMLAERFVSLAWRLRRAERMQNQSIDEMIEHEVTNPLAKHIQKLYCQAEGISYDDSRRSADHLPLGKMATSDWSNCRVIDRMMLYERRIESSMTRMLREFKKQQIMRRIEFQDTGYHPAINGTRAPMEKKVDLKKQSQYVPGLMGATSFIKGDYGNNPVHGIGENKPNQSQSQAHTALKAGRSIRCSSDI